MSENRRYVHTDRSSISRNRRTVQSNRNNTGVTARTGRIISERNEETAQADKDDRNRERVAVQADESEEKRERMVARSDRIGRKKGRSYFDYSLLFIIIFLLCFGFVMVYSTTTYSAQASGLASTYYLKKQIISSCIGLFLMFVIMNIDYRFWRKLIPLIYVGSIALVFLVLTPLGVTYNGARRWLSIAGQSVQPAEFVKVAVILTCAHIIALNIKYMNRLKAIITTLLFAVFPAGIIAVVTNNLSTAIVVLGIAGVMVFIASPNVKEFIGMIALGVGAIALYLLLGSGFRSERFAAWLHPEDYASDTAYQTLQGLYAIGSGGFFGKGLGQSIQKLGFVPEAENDMIFTIICEELGLFGGIAIILLFLFMIRRFMIIANNAPDVFGTMIVIGVMAHISLQVFLNIAVVTNTIPNTGATLPFISYGGTSIAILLAEMGLVFSVSKRIKAI